jgi:hypothetical protein
VECCSPTRGGTHQNLTVVLKPYPYERTEHAMVEYGSVVAEGDRLRTVVRYLTVTKNDFPQSC